MDTLRDKNVLEDHWRSGNPPWKVWPSSVDFRIHHLRKAGL
jgi:hypothetical protein